MPDKEAVKFLEPKILLCDERMATSSRPPNLLWLKKLLSGNAPLSAQQLRLGQAMGLGSWGLAVREVTSVSALAAPQRRLLCEFLGFEEAAILQSEAWDQLTLILLPRLLPVATTMVPRWLCRQRMVCPCSRYACWCRLRCPCQSDTFPSTPSLWVTCWQALRKTSARQLYSLQLEFPCLLVPVVAGGVPVKAENNCWLFLCRHADAATAALSWARLAANPTEIQRRERMKAWRQNIASQSLALHRRGLALAGIKDAAVINASVQVGLLRSRRHWEERLETLASLFGASAELLETAEGEDDADVLRLSFRPVQEKSALPSSRKRTQRLLISTPSTAATRVKKQSEALGRARHRLEEKLHGGWALRKKQTIRALKLFHQRVEQHEATKTKNDEARLAQQGLVRPPKAKKSRKKAHDSEDVPSLCQQHNWKAVFGEPLPGEESRKTKARYLEKLKLLLEEMPPDLSDALCRTYKAAIAELK